MADIRLESVWRSKLSVQGWPDSATEQFKFCLAPSTLCLYNRTLRNYKDYCCLHDLSFPPSTSACVAEYLCHLADSSNRPLSQLKSFLAALSHYLKCCDLPDLSNDIDIKLLYTALVKSSTVTSRTRSHVMPIKPFLELFRSWPDNIGLDIKRLRLKTITLLALHLMLRPSDIAPKAQTFNPDDNSAKPIIFSRNDISFNSDGSANFVFHGTKNDSDRSGFSVHLPAGTQAIIDPINTLKSYITRTQHLCPKDSNPVFLSLNRPFKAISASIVSKILCEAISLAGLNMSDYSAKDFRPTGATYAISQGFNPDTVMKLGRWKTRSVFFEHYVHSVTTDSYVDSFDV